MTWKNELVLLSYLAVFIGCVAALIWQKKRRKKMRLPFGEQLKLLRAPGETQFELVHKLEDDAVFWLLGASMLPLLVFVVLVSVTKTLPATFQLPGVAITLLAVVAAFGAAAKWFANKTSEIGNRYLGYFGERVVAEHLEPLKAHGWRGFSRCARFKQRARV